MIKISRALISCWDKTGLVELGRTLVQYGIEIVASGGTFRLFLDENLPVTAVETLTGFPEVLGGRVKTLHPAIHAGILAASTPEHQKDLDKLGVKTIQLVVVNLYPFVEKAVQESWPLPKAIEMIDIGGPTLLRGAAKNYENVVAVHRPDDYGRLVELLTANNGAIPGEFSRSQAQKIFFYTSWYDAQIQNYFSRFNDEEDFLSERQMFHLQKKSDLRYGENPHQKAAYYEPFNDAPVGFAAMEQLGGKQLSFNNYMDVQAAYTLALAFDEPCAVVVKHSNPCGAALADDLEKALDNALKGDPVSSFGGIFALNGPVTKGCAERVAKIFFECIIAPDFDPGALELLKKKKNLRILKLKREAFLPPRFDVKPVSGGFLLQTPDLGGGQIADGKKTTLRSPSPKEVLDLEFAWRVVQEVKSNAIVFVKNRQIYGVGAGQMSRVDSVRLARDKALQAGRNLRGAVMASDAFFPFRDGIDEAAQAGITAVVQPGGSIRDEEVIRAADEHGMSMVFTGIRHFKH